MFGNRLQQRRESLNMTREDLSIASGVSYNQVSRYENGVNQPTGEAIAALARALGVTSDWLLGIDDVYGIDALSDAERQALAIFRTKLPERQQLLLEMMKMF